MFGMQTIEQNLDVCTWPQNHLTLSLMIMVNVVFGNSSIILSNVPFSQLFQGCFFM